MDNSEYQENTLRGPFNALVQIPGIVAATAVQNEQQLAVINVSNTLAKAIDAGMERTGADFTVSA